MPQQSQTESQAEIDKFRKLGEKETDKIFSKMKSDEIESLQKSLIHDREVLKKLETKGTNIENYKFTDKLLEKKERRLRELLRQ